MPFKSKQQAKKCYALKQKGQAGNWDCSEWAEKTNFRSIPQSKEAFSMTASPHLARIKQAASMAVLQPAFQKLADDHFGGDINSAVAFCEQNRVHPVAVLKSAADMPRMPDNVLPGTPAALDWAQANKPVAPVAPRMPDHILPGTPAALDWTQSQKPVTPKMPDHILPGTPASLDWHRGNAGGAAAKTPKISPKLLKLLSKNKLLAGGAAGALGLAGLGGLGRSMRGSPGAAGGGGGGMPTDIAPGGGGLGGGGGGGLGGGGMSPTMKALLGLGLVGGGAYGASRVFGGKKKKQASDNFANRVLTRVITKKASAVLHAESVRRVNTYLDKLASVVALPEQAQIRLIQGNLAAGNSLAHAIKRACPHLPAESRGVFAAELVKKAAASVR